MIPAWIWTILVVTVGSIAALWLGSYLPGQGMEPEQELGIVCFLAACVLCAVFNNFPFLLAVGCWIPFFPHIGLSTLPTFVYFMGWMMAVLFFRLCVQGYLLYRRSFNWALLLIFAWVPIRFAMNPVTHLGSSAGGSGVSGAFPYFNYVFTASLLVFMGSVLTDRNIIMRYMWWCFIVVLVSGSLLAVCAFIPGMAPVLIKMGAYPAGDIGDGIQRYVELPGYGLFVFEVSLCPALFRLKRWQSVLLFVLGFGMIMLGGNRSALAGAIIVAPVMLFLRGKTHTVVVSIFLMAAAIGAMKFTVDSMDTEQIPKLLRCFGIFDSKIEKASGGDVSANARYGLWKDAMTKIMESPLAGKGFGNLPQHVQGSDAQRSNDFEVVLAGGESHNGFINAAYAFGIPFALALSVAMILYFFKEALLALRTDPHDLEMRELHVFIAGMFASYPILIYTAFDLSDGELWIYAAISTIVSRLPRQDNRPVADAGVALRKYGEEPRPAGQYYYR